MQCYCVKCLIMFCELMFFFLALLLPLLALCEEKKKSVGKI